LRIHREETLRGYLLLIFITLTVFALMKKEIDNDYTEEEDLLTMRNLKSKVYDDELIVQELAKQQKEVVEKLGIIVPKKMDSSKYLRPVKDGPILILHSL
jgi:transposase